MEDASSEKPLTDGWPEMWQTGLRLDPGKNHWAGRPGKVVMTCAQLGTVHPASEKSFHLASCPCTHYIHTRSAVPPPDQRVSSHSGLQVWLGPALLPSQEERKRRLLPRQDGGENLTASSHLLAPESVPVGSTCFPEGRRPGAHALGERGPPAESAANVGFARAASVKLPWCPNCHA